MRFYFGQPTSQRVADLAVRVKIQPPGALGPAERRVRASARNPKPSPRAFISSIASLGFPGRVG
jgi:hypothetical protein